MILYFERLDERAVELAGAMKMYVVYCITDALKLDDIPSCSRSTLSYFIRCGVNQHVDEDYKEQPGSH